MMMKVISHVVTAILTQDCFQAPITGDLFGTKIEDYKLPMMTSVITITESMMTPRTRAMGNGQCAMFVTRARFVTMAMFVTWAMFVTRAMGIWAIGNVQCL